jgi:hypothetical protein
VFAAVSTGWLSKAKVRPMETPLEAGAEPIPGYRSRPNTRVTKGRLEGQSFAFRAKDEEPEADLRSEEATKTWSPG